MQPTAPAPGSPPATSGNAPKAKRPTGAQRRHLGERFTASDTAPGGNRRTRRALAHQRRADARFFHTAVRHVERGQKRAALWAPVRRAQAAYRAAALKRRAIESLIREGVG